MNAQLLEQVFGLRFTVYINWWWAMVDLGNDYPSWCVKR